MANDTWVYGPTGKTALDTATNTFYQYTLDYDQLGNLKGYGWRPVGSTASTTTSTPNVSTVTGVNPVETSYSLYGNIIPLSVFGVGRIGGEIISGPWIENGLASFIISFGVPADPTGTRELREIAFDSEVVWTGSLIGAGTPASSGFSTEPFTVRFYDGTLTQTADALETAHFGADAVAYRPQILLAFENLPIANTKFGKIPYVAAVIADTSGDDVNLGEAFERLASSPWVDLADGFEAVGITDGLVSGGLIISDQTEFLSLLQQFGRFYPKWSILQTDKLRILDRGADVTPDIILDGTMLIDKFAIARQEQNSVPSVLELSTIDPGADYTILPSQALIPRQPVAVTTSRKTDSAYLPAIMDAGTRIAIVTYTQQHEDRARKQINGTAMIRALQMEPGDLLGITALNADFPGGETFRVLETTHGQNYVVEFTAESLLICDVEALTTPPPDDPHWSSVVLLMGFEGLNGSTGAPGFTDETGLHGTAGVPATSHIDTSDRKFGTSSLRSDGNTWAAIFSGSTHWELSKHNSDQFTIECWIKFFEIRPFLNAIVANSFLDRNWCFGVSATSELTFQFLPGGGGSNVSIDSTGASLTASTWYLLAVDKDASGKIRLYKDGVMFGSATPTDSTFVADAGAGIDIGSTGFTGAFTANGWIDELRITKGIARYASDGGFAVPTRAFPRGS